MMTKQELVKRARFEHQTGVRLKRHGYTAMAEQCFWFSRMYMKEARQ